MVGGFGRTMSKISLGLFGAGAGILGPLAGFFTSAVGELDKLNDASERLGASVEDLSALKFAAETSGASFEDMAAAAKFLQRNLVENADDFEKWGLSAEKLRGMGLADQFQAIGDAMKNMAPDARTAMAMDLLGRGGSNVVNVLMDLQNLRQRAGATGSIFSTEDARAAARAADAMDDAWKSFKTTALTVGIALLSEVQRIEQASGIVQRHLAAVREWINQNKTLVVAVAAGAAALIALAGAFGVAAVAAAGLSAILGLLGTVLAAVFSEVDIGIGLFLALAALSGLLFRNSEQMKFNAQELGEAWAVLSEQFEKTFQGMSDALRAGNLKLAFKILTVGLEILWLKMVNRLRAYWDAFIKTVALASTIVDPTGKIGAKLKEVLTVDAQDRADLLDKIKAKEREQEKLLQKAQAERGKVEAQEVFKKGFDIMTAAMGLFSSKLTGPIAKTVEQSLATISRGQFGGALAGQTMGVGNVQANIEKNTKQANKHLKKIEEEVGGVPWE